MAGGDLRLNNRKLKVKHYQKIFLILLRLTLLLNMGNKLYVTSYSDFKIMHPDNTVMSSEDFSCGYESGSRGCKAAKHLQKERK
jgi:hypothetical protein